MSELADRVLFLPARRNLVRAIYASFAGIYVLAPFVSFPLPSGPIGLLVWVLGGSVCTSGLYFILTRFGVLLRWNAPTAVVMDVGLEDEIGNESVLAADDIGVLVIRRNLDKPQGDFARIQLWAILVTDRRPLFLYQNKNSVTLDQADDEVSLIAQRLADRWFLRVVHHDARMLDDRS